MSEYVLNSFSRIYSHLPPHIQQFTYAHFKELWKQHDVGYLMLSKSEDEPSEYFMQELYQGLTEQLAAIPPPPSVPIAARTQLDEVATAAGGANQHTDIAPSTGASVSDVPSLADSSNSYHLRKRVAIFYLLYTLYHCQVSNRKHRIIIPQYLWSVLDDCAHEFLRLPIRDPILILRDLVSRQQFEFTLAAAEIAEEDSEVSSTLRIKREGINEADLMEMKNNESQADRPPKQRRLLDDSDFGEGALEMFDLKSQLQLSKLREMSLAYAQAMHDYQDGVSNGKPALTLSRTPSGANAAIGATSSSSLPMLQQLSLVHPTHSSLIPQSNTFSSSSFKLLSRVERAVEEQDGLREALRKQRDAEAASASFMPLSNAAIPSSSTTSPPQQTNVSAAPTMRATQAVKANASPFLAQPIAVDIHSVAAAAAAAQQHQ